MPDLRRAAGMQPAAAAAAEVLLWVLADDDGLAGCPRPCRTHKLRNDVDKLCVHTHWSVCVQLHRGLICLPHSLLDT